jgi:hypothetical protein
MLVTYTPFSPSIEPRTMLPADIHSPDDLVLKLFLRQLRASMGKAYVSLVPKAQNPPAIYLEFANAIAEPLKLCVILDMPISRETRKQRHELGSIAY